MVKKFLLEFELEWTQHSMADINIIRRDGRTPVKISTTGLLGKRRPLKGGVSTHFGLLINILNFWGDPSIKSQVNDCQNYEMQASFDHHVSH